MFLIVIYCGVFPHVVIGTLIIEWFLLLIYFVYIRYYHANEGDYRTVLFMSLFFTTIFSIGVIVFMITLFFDNPDEFLFGFLFKYASRSSINISISLFMYILKYLIDDCNFINFLSTLFKSISFKIILETIILFYNGSSYFHILNKLGLLLMAHRFFGSAGSVKNIYDKILLCFIALINMQGKFSVKCMVNDELLQIDVIQSSCSPNNIRDLFLELINTYFFSFRVKNHGIEKYDEHMTKMNESKILSVNFPKKLGFQSHNIVLDEENHGFLKDNTTNKFVPRLFITTGDNDLFDHISKGTEYSCPCVNNQVLINKGFKLQSLQYSNYPTYLHTCGKNLIESALRQYGGMGNSVDPDIFDSYKIFVKSSYINSLQEFLDKDKGKIDWLDWLNSTDPKKKPLYLEAYKKYKEEVFFMNNTQFYNDYALQYKLHTKTDEKIFQDPSTMDCFKNKPVKSKARAIIEEHDVTKVLMGPIVKRVKDWHKTQPWYGVGFDNYERCILFNDWVEELGGPDKVDIICIDGSAFDSTQHSCIQEVMDSTILSTVIENHYSDIEAYANVDHAYIAALNRYKKVTGNINKSNCNPHKTTVNMFLDGTTGSGTMFTSDGNCERSSSYIRFALSMMLIKCNECKYMYMEDGFPAFCRYQVCGDDAIIFVKKEFTKLLEIYLKKYVYSEKAGVQHGLGQIAKSFIVCDFKTLYKAEYLSCNFMYVKTDEIMSYRWDKRSRWQNKSTHCLYMVRKPERVLQLWPWSRSIKSTSAPKIISEIMEYAIADCKEMITWCKGIDLLEAFTQYGLLNKLKNSYPNQYKQIYDSIHITKDNRKYMESKYMLSYNNKNMQSSYSSYNKIDLNKQFLQLLNDLFDLSEGDILELKNCVFNDTLVSHEIMEKIYKTNFKNYRDTNKYMKESNFIIKNGKLVLETLNEKDCIRDFYYININEI